MLFVWVWTVLGTDACSGPQAVHLFSVGYCSKITKKRNAEESSEGERVVT